MNIILAPIIDGATITFSNSTILAREVLAGAWSVSTLFLLLFVLYYIACNIGTKGPLKWWRDPPVEFAIALAVLMVGHLIRSFGTWLSFISIDNGGDWGAEMFDSWWYLLLATGIIIIGKMMCVWSLARPRRRWKLTAWLAVSAVVIPTLVLML